MNAIFLYGSLLDDRLRHAVFADTICHEQIIKAVASDFATMRYPGESFPVLIPHDGGKVEGAILLEPSDEAMARMAFYEGDEYEIDRLSVEVNGQKIQALYNRALDLEGLSFDEIWSLEAWRRAESDILVEIAKQYMQRCWGKMNVTEADRVWQELQSLRLNEPRPMSGASALVQERASLA